MSWLDIFKSKQQLEVEKAAISMMRGFNNRVSNWDDSDQYISDGYEYNAVLYGIISKTSRKAASIINKYTKLYNSKGEEVENKELEMFFKNPNSLESSLSFSEKEITYNMITGNSLMYQLKDDRGIPRESIILPVANVDININNGTYDLNDGSGVSIPFEDVSHRKYIALANDQLAEKIIWGMSPLKPGSRTVLTNNETRNAMISLLKNCGAIGMLSGYANDDKDIDEEDLTAIKTQYKSKYQGTQNLGDVVITSAALKWTPMNASANDMELNAQQEADIKELCNLYSVPPEIMGIDSTYNTREEALKDWITSAVLPQANGYIEAWNKHIAIYYGDFYFKIDESQIDELQKDYERLANWMNTVNYALTENEIREALGFDKIENDPLADYTYGRLKREGLDGSIPPMMLNTGEDGN